MTDIPVEEIFRKIIVPDMWQLENAITVGGKLYVGSIAFIAADHVEICKIAGIATGTVHTLMSYRCSLRPEYIDVCL